MLKLIFLLTSFAFSSICEKEFVIEKIQQFCDPTDLLKLDRCDKGLHQKLKFNQHHLVAAENLAEKIDAVDDRPSHIKLAASICSILVNQITKERWGAFLLHLCKKSRRCDMDYVLYVVFPPFERINGPKENNILQLLKKGELLDLFVNFAKKLDFSDARPSTSQFYYSMGNSVCDLFFQDQSREEDRKFIVQHFLTEDSEEAAKFCSLILMHPDQIAELDDSLKIKYYAKIIKYSEEIDLYNLLKKGNFWRGVFSLRERPDIISAVASIVGNDKVQKFLSTLQN